MIDAHLHVVSPETDSYPQAEAPPFQTHTYTYPVESLVSDLPGSGVSGAILVQPFAMYGYDNTYQAHAVGAGVAAGARLVGVCGVATSASGIEDMRHWVTEVGMAGARINTLGQAADLTGETTKQLCELSVTLGVPLCLTTSRKHLTDVIALAAAFPELDIVLDHAGITRTGLTADDGIRTVAPLTVAGNVYFKVTTPLLQLDGGGTLLRFLVGEAGSGRVLWGSNFPVTDVGGYAATVAASSPALAALTDDERAAVTTRTAEALYPGLTASAPAIE